MHFTVDCRTKIRLKYYYIVLMTHIQFSIFLIITRGRYAKFLYETCYHPLCLFCKYLEALKYVGMLVMSKSVCILSLNHDSDPLRATTGTNLPKANRKQQNETGLFRGNENYDNREPGSKSLCWKNIPFVCLHYISLNLLSYYWPKMI